MKKLCIVDILGFIWFFRFVTVHNDFRMMIYFCCIVYFSQSTSASDLFDNVYYPGRILDSFSIDDNIKIPVFHRTYSRIERKTKFTGTFNISGFTSYDQDSHVHGFQTKQTDESKYLSWETVAAKTGKRVATYVNVDKTIESYHLERLFKRKKRDVRERIRKNIFGRDDRLYVPLNEKVGLVEPYSYTVRISTGCSGIAISPQHILTAAHCVHDQKDYIKESKEIQVGFLNELNNVSWIDVKSIIVSKGWIIGGVTNGPFYDYALLTLTKKHGRSYIVLTVSENDQHGVGERISFNGFDDDKPESSLWTRTCNVVEDDQNFLYHYCDAQPGSSGSGVYSWVYDEILNDWRRELIGVFSGNRWRAYDEFYIVTQNFNVAVRLTSNKYAQICNWMGKIGEEVCRRSHKYV
ncbi:inactive serine protease 35 isoform X2 [Hydra vulgaris]|uniref:inactive serine protease 35 isoform X2 n=2 Tax=Hydra vulgaris TaxID=6087 RepID=UPI001F5F3BB3|nr:inactive serine protease 35 isoform X1 [Hydra vulgaris]